MDFEVNFGAIVIKIKLHARTHARNVKCISISKCDNFFQSDNVPGSPQLETMKNFFRKSEMDLRHPAP